MGLLLGLDHQSQRCILFDPFLHSASLREPQVTANVVLLLGEDV